MNSPELIRWNSSKEYLLELEKSGFPIVPTSVFDSYDTSLSAALGLMGTQASIVIKPAVSAEADLTFIVHDKKDLPSMIHSIMERGKLLLQPFVKTITVDGELSLIYFNIDSQPKFAHAVKKRPKAGDFRVQESLDGITEPTTVSNSLIKFGEKVCASLKHPWAFARIDLVDWQKTPRIGEVELIEPSLYFAHSPSSAPLMVRAIEQYYKG